MMYPKPNYTKQRKARGASRARSKNSVPESALQKQVEEYLDWNGYNYIRIPDELYRYVYAMQFVPIWIKKIISKYVAGVPDITILKKEGVYVCIELKTESGKLSVAQKRFRDSVGVENYHVCRSLDDVVMVLGGNK